MDAKITDIVSTLIKALVDEPDKVEVTETKGEKTTIYEARVAKNDMGKVIGRNGRTIDSLRVIVSACGAKRKRKMQLPNH